MSLTNDYNFSHITAPLAKDLGIPLRDGETQVNTELESEDEKSVIRAVMMPIDRARDFVIFAVSDSDHREVLSLDVCRRPAEGAPFRAWSILDGVSHSNGG
jgi:hypothetical protein